MKSKLRKDEIETIVEYFEDFVKTLIYERQSDSTHYNVIQLAKSRDNLINHLMEMFGEKDEEQL